MARVTPIVTDLMTSLDGESKPILAPAMKGLPVGAASALTMLPIHDANGQLLAQVARAAGQYPGVRAGVFAVDEFRRSAGILDELRNAGINHLVNWPSVAFLGPEIEVSHSMLGIGYDREVEFACNATSAKWSMTGVVMDTGQATKMLDAGCQHLLFHPRLDLVTHGYLDAAALAAFDEISAAARKRDVDVSFYAEIADLSAVPGNLPFQLDVFTGGA